MKVTFLSKLLEKIKGGERPPFEKYYVVIFVVIFAFLIADVGNLFARKYLVPTGVPVKKAMQVRSNQVRQYQFPGIISKNIFNSDGVIPPTQSEIQGGGNQGSDGAPRLSSLPLDIMGTLVHADPSKSIATIAIKGQNRVEPFSVDDEVSGMAKIKEIQRYRVVFRNLQNQMLEYIEVQQAAGPVLSVERGATVKAPQEETTEFTFQRAEIDAQLENLPNLLQQALALPEQGPDGQIRCYKMVEIQPGSIYEKLGLRVGDCLMGVNGENVNSPQKAMDAYQALRSTPEIKLSIDRGGREVDLNYKIR